MVVIFIIFNSLCCSVEWTHCNWCSYCLI